MDLWMSQAITFLFIELVITDQMKAVGFSSYCYWTAVHSNLCYSIYARDAAQRSKNMRHN